MDNQELFVIQGDSDHLKRRPVLVVTQVDRTVVWDRRPGRGRLVEDKAAVSHDELDLSFRDAVLESRLREDEIHTGLILYDKTALAAARGHMAGCSPPFAPVARGAMGASAPEMSAVGHAPAG